MKRGFKKQLCVYPLFEKILDRGQDANWPEVCPRVCWSIPGKDMTFAHLNSSGMSYAIIKY